MAMMQAGIAFEPVVMAGDEDLNLAGFRNLDGLT